MAKNRTVNTEFWLDEYVTTLKQNEKLLFLYFITSPISHICGIYRIPVKTICSDTGFTEEEIIPILDKLEKDNKVLYRNGWIALKNGVKHQNCKKGNVAKGIENGLKEAPEELKKWILSEKPLRAFKSLQEPSRGANYFDSDFDSDFDSNIDIDSDINKNRSNDLNKEIYKRIIDGFYQYHNKKYKFDDKERGTAKRLATLLSTDENWETTLEYKITGLLKKVKENPKFWAFTIPKLEYGWNEFIEQPKEDNSFIDKLDFRNKK